MSAKKAGPKPIATFALLVALVTALIAIAVPAAAGAAPPGCKNRTNTTYQTLLTCVTLEGVRAHQAAFQAIANANTDAVGAGTRAAGTSGYTGSVAYVAGLLREAGYTVTLDEFPFTFVGATLRQNTPVSATYPSGAFTGSASGNVTAAVTPVDINLVPPRATDSGCSTDLDGVTPENDFVGFPAGNIALVQRGFCTFAEKVQNAQAAGASAVIIFNQGNTPDREGLIIGTLAPLVASVPVVGGSFANGVALSQTGSTATVIVVQQSRPQVNVIAERTGVNDDNVVMAGAHLDSVLQGPGINDNGSGSAALLETALMMAKVKPQNTLRFAWWGAEEAGLVGSTAYVAEQVANGSIDEIALYLNYDMVGSPNYVFFVYDGDNSDATGAPAGPPGSKEIEDVYEAYYTSRGIPYKGTDFSGRSDYGPFIAPSVGIPSGGLFTGAEGIKTPEEAATWGGTAGAQYDPCYHIACDTFAGTGSGVG